MKFRCAGIHDVLDGGIGAGLGIFFQGCSIHCDGCQNPDLQSHNGGYEANTDTVIRLLERFDYYSSVVFLGGEPTEQEAAVLDIVTRTSLPCVLFTGKLYNTLSTELKQLMYMVIDGPYMAHMKTGGFPASSNQNIYIEGVKQ